MRDILKFLENEYANFYADFWLIQ
ncbi:Protein of unknown function [Bacillus cereus]|nr:Protein of unknown function [Bacillus mobilis]SCN03361.1 Protein of unknown function [Bacillus cereus]